MTVEDVLLQVIRGANGPLNTSDILKECLKIDSDINLSTADRTLRKLAERHEIRRRGDGTYSYQIDTTGIKKLEAYM